MIYLFVMAIGNASLMLLINYYYYYSNPSWPDDDKYCVVQFYLGPYTCISLQSEHDLKF